MRPSFVGSNQLNPLSYKLGGLYLWIVIISSICQLNPNCLLEKTALAQFWCNILLSEETIINLQISFSQKNKNKIVWIEIKNYL